MVEILYKSKNAIVIYKPQGIPSQSDPTGDKDALTLTSELLKSVGENASRLAAYSYLQEIKNMPGSSPST